MQQISSDTKQAQVQSEAEQLVYELAVDGFDETRTPQGEFKPHWQYLLDSFSQLGPQSLQQRQEKADRILRDDGATYNIYSDNRSPNRTWDLDLVPSLIGSEDWAIIEAGLSERAELFDLLLKDLYGERNLIRHGVIPPEIIYSDKGFLRACDGMKVSGERQLILHAVDLIRSDSGGICVLTDRTQAPSGAGYALENRTVMSRVLPSVFRDSHVHRLAHYFQTMRQTMLGLSNSGELPRVVVLTPGAHNETYFEHAYLANYLGFQLVQAGDLTVRNGFVWMKSLQGMSRVDVILRRVDDAYCDPVELRSDSRLGIPGLLEVVRSGRVVVANPLGSGILENPIFLRFLPEISKCLLGRELRIPSVSTYWCADEKDFTYIKANLDSLVIKPSFRQSSSGSVWGQDLNEKQRQDWLAILSQKPHQYVAQDAMQASHVPTFDGHSLAPRPVLLRSFAVADEGTYRLMPGGLTRVGPKPGSHVISNQLGARSKDTWVVASEPERVSPQTAPADWSDQVPEPQDVGLPSRVVENLFWMGRYAERAEASLRLLRTIFMLLNGEEPVSTVAKRTLLRTLSEVTTTLPGFVGATDALIEHPDEELLLVVNDGNKAGSVRSTLNAMLFSADESKELLSSDMLRVINDIRDALDSLDGALQGGLASAPEEALDPLVTALMALSGLANESMSRGAGWRFMDMGRRLERGLQTISTLKALLVPVTNEGDQETLMSAMLRSLEVLITYRQRYRARMNPKWGLELVYLDTSNPRSLLFQFERLQSHIDELRGNGEMVELTREQRYLMQAITEIKLSRLSSLARRGREGKRQALEQQLDALKVLLSQLSDGIRDKYFDHRVDSYQLVRTDWEPEE